MRVETIEQYLARREQEELLLSISAPQPQIADVHFALAEVYRVKRSEVAGLGATTPLLTEPLSVATKGGEIVLDGQLPVAALLTPAAAIETGVSLIEAGLHAEPLSDDAGN